MSNRLSILLFLGASAALGLRLEASAEEQPSKANTPRTADDSPSPPETDPGEKYTLAFKFRPNQVVRYEVTNETEITTNFKGDTETVRNKSESIKNYRVTAVEESGAGDLELSIEWVHMVASFSDPDGAKAEPVEFQSDDPTKHPAKFRHILDTVGKPRATIRFSPTGKPLKVLAGAPQPPPVAANQIAAGAAAPPVADTSPESYFVPFPEKPVAIGEVWKDRFDVIARNLDRNPVKVTMQRTFRLAEVKQGRALIELRTAILTPVQDQAVAGQLIQREISGKIDFDIERGLILSRESGVDNTVVNPFGPKSSMRARSQYHERILTSEATAARGVPAGATTSK